MRSGRGVEALISMIITDVLSGSLLLVRNQTMHKGLTQHVHSDDSFRIFSSKKRVWLSILLRHNMHKMSSKKKTFFRFITKTCLYKIDPLKPHFYIVKLGFTGVYIIFLISVQKHRLWVLVRTASPRRFLRVPTIYVLTKV